MSKTPKKSSVTGTTLLGLAIRGLFLESSWNDDGQQNLGRAAVLFPAARGFLKRPPSGPGGAQMAELELAESLTGPFNTNPVTSGLSLGAALRMEEERSLGLGKSRAECAALLSSLSSVSSAQGDQVFWNTWLPFCSLLAFFATHFTGSPLAPFLLPLLFCALAVPARISAFFLGYRRGREVCADKSLALVLSLRRKLHTAIFFLSGVFTALLISRLAGSGGGPSLLVWAEAALFFGVLLASDAVRKRWRVPGGPLYLLNAVLFYLIFMFF